MARILLLFAMAGLLSAQPALTPIRDTIYDQSGGLYSGPVTISLSIKSGSAGLAPVVSTVRRLQVTAGVLAVALVPNTAITPAGSSYVVTFGNGGQRTCTIPSSATAIALAPYCTDLPPANPSPVIPWTWMAPPTTGGQPVADGSYCLVVSGGRVLGLVACSGGGGTGNDPRGKTWSQLTFATWSQLTTYTWSQMQ